MTLTPSEIRRKTIVIQRNIQRKLDYLTNRKSLFLTLKPGEPTDPEEEGGVQIPPGTSFYRVDTSEVGFYDLVLPSACDVASVLPMTITHDAGVAPVRIHPGREEDGVNGPPGATRLLMQGETLTFCAYCDLVADTGKWIIC